MTFESASRTYIDRPPFNPLRNPRRDRREAFNVFKKIQGVAKKVGDGVKKGAGETKKGLATAVNKTGGGLKAFPGIVKKSVLGPVWNFIKNIGAWVKFVLCLVCCVCILSCCTMLGVPQMVFGMISSSSRSGATGKGWMGWMGSEASEATEAPEASEAYTSNQQMQPV